MDAPTVEIAEGCIRMAGELTIHQVEQMRVALLEALVSAGDVVTLDLSAVREIDTAGLQLLMSVDRELLGRGSTLQVGAASQTVRDTVQLFGQQRLLAGEESHR